MTQSVNLYDDASKYTLGNIWSCEKVDLAKNFPACKFLLHWDDIDNGDLVWKDRVLGASIKQSDPTGFVKDSKGVRRGISTAPSSGTMPAPGTKDFVFIWGGTIENGTDSVELGNDYYGVGVNLVGNASGNAAISYTNLRTSAALAPVPTYPLHCLTLHIDNSGDELRKSGANSDGTQVSASLKAAGGATIAANWGALESTTNETNIKIPTSTTSGVKMLALLVFNTKPSTTEMAIANKWMAANPGKLYPGFAGRL